MNIEPIKIKKEIYKRIKEYSEQQFYTNNIKFNNNILNTLLQENNIFSDLYIEGILGAEQSSVSFRESTLIDDKLKDILNKSGKFNLDHNMYKHQVKALEIVTQNNKNKPAIIISARTGGGKTEAFLIPMLNSLIKNKRSSITTGVRAIILYPMNALVFDQTNRLCNYLSQQDELTIFPYNSNIPEDKPKDKVLFDHKCVVTYRKKARKSPPDIMITNYSMLEYILSRPSDFPLIGNALEFIVLDEAHLYNGSLAAEISLLLGRTLNKANVSHNQVTFLASSATISTANENQTKDFFAKLSNKEKDDVHIVLGEYPSIQDPGKILPEDLKNFNINLHGDLSNNKIVNKLKYLLSNELISINKLADEFDNNLTQDDMLDRILHLSKMGNNILPIKFHLLAKAPNSPMMCINIDCKDAFKKIYSNNTVVKCGCDKPLYDVYKCVNCFTPYIIKSYLEVFSVNSNKCVNYCETCNVDLIEKNNKNLVKLYISDQVVLPIMAETFMLNMLPVSQTENPHLLPSEGRKLLIFSDSRKDAARLGPLLVQQYQRYMLNKEIYNSLKLIKEESANNNKQNIEIQKQLEDPNLNELIKEIVRKQLKQSVNDSYGTFKNIFLKIINNENILKRLYNLDALRKQYASTGYQEWSKWNIEQNKKSVAQFIAQDLILPPYKNYKNLESAGLISFNFNNLELIAPNENLLSQNFVAIAKNIRNDFPIILKMFFLILRNRGCINYTNDSLIETYRPINFWAVLTEASAKDRKLQSLYTIKELNDLICNLIDHYSGKKPSDIERNKLIELIFESIISFKKDKDIENNVLPWLEFNQNVQRVANNATFEAIRLNLEYISIDVPKELYLHQNNYKIFSESIDGITPFGKGANKISQDELNIHEYFGRMRIDLFDNKTFDHELWADEHSAQIDPTEIKRIQDLFIEGKRNILSATTTLEVGIDIGSLYGVMLANIPPKKANYFQRTGRVGRRLDGASSIAISFARQTSVFDINVFNNFQKYLNEPYLDLSISLEQDLIVERHFNSLLFYLFFKQICQTNNSIKALDVFKSYGYFLGFPSLNIDNDSQIVNYKERFIKFLEEFDCKENLRLFMDVFKNTNITKLNEFENCRDNLIIKVKSTSEKYTNSLNDLKKEFRNEHINKAKINAIRYSYNNIYDKSIIEILSNNKILPKYGFPINVNSLFIQHKELRDITNLQRDDTIGVKEYAPGASIIVSGRMVKSRGLLKFYTGNNFNKAFGDTGYYYKCNSGHYFAEEGNNKQCPEHNCNEKQKKIRYLSPKYGYTTAAYEKPLLISNFNNAKMNVPDNPFPIYSENEKNFSVEDELFEYDYYENIELVTINSGTNKIGFSICTKCGFADSHLYDGSFSSDYKNHSSIYNYKQEESKCLSTNLDDYTMSNMYLSSSLITSGMIVKLKNKAEYNLLQTIGNSLKLSGAKLLGISENEIGCVILKEINSIIIYDANSGGVGYVHSLLKLHLNEWKILAKERLFVSQHHYDSDCKGCIQCVLTFRSKNEELNPKNAFDYFENKVENLSQKQSVNTNENKKNKENNFAKFINKINTDFQEST